jgi:hypothetical protein
MLGAAISEVETYVSSPLALPKPGPCSRSSDAPSLIEIAVRAVVTTPPDDGERLFHPACSGAGLSTSGEKTLFKATIPVDQCRTPFIHPPIWPERVEHYRAMIRIGTPGGSAEFSLQDGKHRVAACRLEEVEQVEAAVICLTCFRTHKPCDRRAAGLPGVFRRHGLPLRSLTSESSRGTGALTRNYRVISRRQECAASARRRRPTEPIWSSNTASTSE